MLDAYLDESGIHDGAKVCVIAGYFGCPSKMRKLESDWKRVLDAHKLPMKDFHAKDLVKTNDSYPLLKELARVIGEQKGVFPVTRAILVDDFNSLSLEQREYITGAMLNPVSGKLVTSGCPSKPYFAPFLDIVKLITDATPVSGKAHFTFGTDKQFHGYAREMFRRITEDAAVDKPYSTWQSKERLGDARFPLADETPQLQAADLLVHLTYRVMEDWVACGKGGTRDPRLPELLKLCCTNSRSDKDHVYQNKLLLQQAITQAKARAPLWKDK